MFRIGDFSRITGLSVKTLRFYHEKGLLVPTCVDQRSGYRYYDRSGVDRARAIGRLRDLELPLEVIGEILRSAGDAHRPDRGPGPAESLAGGPDEA